MVVIGEGCCVYVFDVFIFYQGVEVFECFLCVQGFICEFVDQLQQLYCEFDVVQFFGFEFQLIWCVFGVDVFYYVFVYLLDVFDEVVFCCVGLDFWLYCGDVFCVEFGVFGEGMCFQQCLEFLVFCLVVVVCQM